MAVVHIHIPKCGGTTLRYLLASQYPTSRIYPVPLHPGAHIVDEPYPVQYTNDPLPGIRAYGQRYDLVMGNFDWRAVSPNDQVIVMLRHPVDHLISTYRYLARSKDRGAIQEWKVVGSLGLDGWLESEHVRHHLNFMTGALSSFEQPDLEAAKAHLNQCAVIGIVEQFDESITRIEKVFGYQFERPIPRHNAASTRSDINIITRERIAALRPDDMALYEHAASLFTPRKTARKGK